MILFILGAVKLDNAVVTFGKDEHKAFVKRDAEGNLTVTVDALEPLAGTSVLLVNKDENNSEYRGHVNHSDGKLLLKA